MDDLGNIVASAAIAIQLAVLVATLTKYIKKYHQGSILKMLAAMLHDIKVNLR